MNNFEHLLETRYKALYNKEPPNEETWLQAPPAIPFVGDNYGQEGRCKVLVYGSAENLTYLAKLPQDRITADASIDRNRKLFQQWRTGATVNERKSVDNWFPWVHMTPISDGTLLTAARYLLQALGKKGFAEDPKDFLQQIAVGNYGKFSLKGGRNTDYAGRSTLLKVSDAYVLADMEVLRPEVVILPITIHWNRFDAIIKNHGGHTPGEVWRIYQTNTGVINRTIKRQLPAEWRENYDARPPWVAKWCEHTPKGVDMGVYLDWLDWKIATDGGGTKARWPIVFKQQGL